jgi:protein SCO1/2
MLCSEVLNGILKASQGMKMRMGHDYAVLTVSIDPHDTPRTGAAKKKSYAGSYRRDGAETGWHFLTGSSASIEALTRAVGFRYRYDPQSDQYAHASGIIVLTPEGRTSRYFYGIDYAPDELSRALSESSKHKIGGLVQQVLLLCFHYDPATGRYGLAISRVIRLLARALVIVGAIYLTRMYLLERNRSRAVFKQVP